MLFPQSSWWWRKYWPRSCWASRMHPPRASLPTHARATDHPPPPSGPYSAPCAPCRSNDRLSSHCAVRNPSTHHLIPDAGRAGFRLPERASIPAHAASAGSGECRPDARADPWGLTNNSAGFRDHQIHRLSLRAPSRCFLADAARRRRSRLDNHPAHRPCLLHKTPA